MAVPYLPFVGVNVDVIVFNVKIVVARVVFPVDFVPGLLVQVVTGIGVTKQCGNGAIYSGLHNTKYQIVSVSVQ